MTRWGRVARGTVAALVSVFFAAFAHSLAGGTLPGVAGIALCIAFSVLVCIALTSRRLKRIRMIASILASQAMYHWLFGTLGTLGVAASPTPGTLGHIHNAPVNFSALTVVVHTHGDMLLAHVAAAIITFGALAFGERSLVAATETAKRFARSLLSPLPSATKTSADDRIFAHLGLATTLLAHRLDHSGLRHRGPPASCAA